MKKLPRHAHLVDDLPLTGTQVRIDQVPKIDWARMAFDTLTAFISQVGNIGWNYITKTAANICDTLGSWAAMIAEFGNLTWSQITKTYQNICSTLGSWANIITELGNVAWSQVTKTYVDICATLGSWANMIVQLGNVAWVQVTKTTGDIASYLSGVYSNGTLDLWNVGAHLLAPAKVFIEGAVTLANWIFSGGKINIEKLSKNVVETTYLGYTSTYSINGTQLVTGNGSYTREYDLGTTGFPRCCWSSGYIGLNGGDNTQGCNFVELFYNNTDAIYLSRYGTIAHDWHTQSARLAGTIMGVLPANKTGTIAFIIYNDDGSSQSYIYNYRIFQIPAHQHDLW